MVPLSAVAFVVSILLAGISTGAWTYYDASSRNAVYAGTIAAIVAVFLPAVLVYVYYRDRIGPRTRPAVHAETAAGAIAFGSLLAVLAGRVISPQDPYTTGPTQAFLLPFGVFLGLLWMTLFTSESTLEE
jgi:hypothetical protein